MRKALLALTPLVLAGLILYVLWEPTPEPITRRPDTAAGVSDLEDVVPDEQLAEGNRDPERVSVPEPPLTIEEYREALGKLAERHESAMKMIAIQREVMEAAARNELVFQKEIERLQEHNLEEARFRRAMTKLRDGQFKKTSRPPGSAGWSMQIDSSLTISTSGHWITFEFLPGEDAEVFAIREGQGDARDALRQLPCDELNRLPFEDRKARIDSHLEATEVLRLLERAGMDAYMTREALADLERNVLPEFMVVDRENYTVKPGR